MTDLATLAFLGWAIGALVTFGIGGAVSEMEADGLIVVVVALLWPLAVFVAIGYFIGKHGIR